MIKLWTDMHSNLHHEKIDKLPEWFEHASQIIDFWPFAYYPFYMRPTECGLAVEDIHDDELVQADWEKIREFTKKVNEEGYPMFMGYEWQGAGKDGDHNVFFLGNDEKQMHPLRYEELVAEFKGKEAIGIPHHIAYQLGSRGKNWATHNEEFSPVAEIYSSHGCSETEDISIDMARHVHMGPRTGGTDYVSGLDAGYKVGVIASGDNHSVPAMYDNGLMCVIAEDRSKEGIWKALRNRHTYGVSKSRMSVDFSIDDAIMGDEVFTKEDAQMHIAVEGSNAIDRIEILKDNILEEMVVHSGTWERNPLSGIVRFKFKLELGWGPDTRIYEDIFMKKWAGKLLTEGKILRIEKCFNNFGQKIIEQTDQSCEFELTTYKSTQTGKWMGTSNITNEAIVFDIEANVEDSLTLELDGKTYCLPIRNILEKTEVIPLMDEVKDLTKERFGEINHYRDDPFWHNVYKIKIHKGCSESGFKLDFNRKIQVTEACNYRLRIWQKNGDVAWTSPIFIKKYN